MRYINQLKYQIILVISCLKEITLLNLKNYYDTNSSNVILFYPKNFKEIISYFTRAYILHDLSIIFALISQQKKFKIIGYKNFGKIRNCEVYYQYSYFTNPYNFEDHSDQTYFLLKSIEKNSNTLKPKPEDIIIWENKVSMHERLKQLNIPTPKTQIVRVFNFNNLELKVEFPFLIKEPYSNHSKGIYFIKNKEEFIEKASCIFKYSNTFLVQEIIDMHRDSRTVVVGSDIIYHYWRTKNSTTEFTTTSTSNGSNLDLTEHTSKNQLIICDYAKKLGLDVAAFDITFENDDENNTPIVLEVSPSFLINPIPINQKDLIKPYKDYKKSWKFGKERAKAALNFKTEVFNRLYK